MAAPSRGRRLANSGFDAAFVPGYSGGTATDLNRFPYSSLGQQVARDTQVTLLKRATRVPRLKLRCYHVQQRSQTKREQDVGQARSATTIKMIHRQTHSPWNGHGIVFA